MKKLQELWEQNKHNFDIEKLAVDLRENKLNKTINIIPYNKSEWLSDNLTNNDKTNCIFNTMPYNGQTIKHLNEKAKANGYNN